MTKSFLIMFMILSLSMCAAVQEDTTTTESTTSTSTTTTTTVIRQYSINIFDTGYSTVGAYYYSGSAWSGVTPMSNDGTWWTLTYTGTNDTAFYFQLNGSGSYPSSTKYYRGSAEELWVRDGILYDYDPTGDVPTNEIAVLELNLHTYQESDPYTKLGYVAELIARGNIDFVAFMECAQHTSSNTVTNLLGVPIKQGNMAYIITSILATNYNEQYHYYWNWSHFGWDVWEEGAAVIARTNFDLLAYERKYISTSTSQYSIDSRTAIFGRFAHPMLDEFNLFSTHVSWGTVQTAQLNTLKTYASSKITGSTGATLICGDFNMNYNSSGYKTMTTNGEYDDAYRTVQPRGAADNTMSDGTRIDYHFTRTGSRLVPVTAQRVFIQVSGLDNTFKQVSDHYGVIVRYRIE